ncbi:MAG: MBL fold metallo-hydrolase [Helicobacteraceae bacterium]|nr:MBL fold metallo-hydrolase [Helicobacteraceae bacterium]
MEQRVYVSGGGFQTNCYLLINDGGSLIVDPGIDTAERIIADAPNPLAVLNTHGHIDHVWSNKLLQERLGVPVYIHKNDSYMLTIDMFGMGLTPSKADVEITDENYIELGGFSFRFVHFPGHSPGCSMIEFDDRIFSGDFIFDGTIGRSDFAGSSPADMKKSLVRFLAMYDTDKPLYPGHGKKTSIERAKKFIPRFIA